MKRAVITLLLIFCFMAHTQAQTPRIDSLQNALKTAKGKNAQVDVLNELCWELSNSAPKKALSTGRQALDLAQSLPYSQGEATALKNIGVVYQYQGNYPQALEHYLKSLTIFEKLKNEAGIANVLNNIGIVYRSQGNYDEALKYYERVRKIDEKNNDKTGVASVLNNLGNIYYQRNDYAKARELYSKSLAIEKELNDQSGLAISYNNLGLVAFAEKQVKKSLEYHFKALKLEEQASDRTSMAGTLGYIADVYQQTDELNKALKYALQGFEIAEEVESQALVMNLSQSLMVIYEGLKQFDKAYEYQTYYVFAKDEVFSEANTKRLTNLQAAYELEKKQAEIALLKAKEARDKAKRVLNQSIGVGIIIVLIIGVAFLYTRSRRRKRINAILLKQRNDLREKNEEINQQKEEILTQRDAIEERNEQILRKTQDIESSIQYAKRIQEAILPNRDEMKEALPEHFVYYLPRDIVSGDFYWFAKTEPQPVYSDSPDFQGNKLLKGFENEKLVLAAVDCTGHGVPGAFMSAIGDSLLNHIVFDRRLTDPAEILGAMQEGVRKALRQDELSNRDGMDMGLMVVDMEKRICKYASAKSWLWLFQNGELQEIKGDNMAIGGWQPDVKTSFTTHTFSLDTPTTIYMASDGYQDQFGGKKGKKFMRRRFRELLQEIYTLPMEQQYARIERTMQDWMAHTTPEGDVHAQVDDMLVVGVHFPLHKQSLSFRSKTDFSKHI